MNQSLSADLLQILQTVVTVTSVFGDDAVHCAEAGAHFLCDHPATIFFTRYITARVRPCFGGEAPPWESSTALRRK
ncbi:MAG: hypothetical protein ACLU9S_24230 [Oscillospiraceae bacterium]